MKQFVLNGIRSLGLDVVRLVPRDFEAAFLPVLRQVQPYTMTSPARIYGVWQAAAYLAKNQIPGAVVECGVWRGGSAMAAACALLKERDTDREIWLYDTFEGMSQPTEKDRSKSGEPALAKWLKSQKRDGTIDWCLASLDEVRANMIATGYPPERIRYVKGPVEETLPAEIPETIALLRLDTDWYESTRHELIHLYPRLVSGGVLIIDDYGDWQGARQAVDEYLAASKASILLNRLDGTGRIAVKP